MLDPGLRARPPGRRETRPGEPRHGRRRRARTARDAREPAPAADSRARGLKREQNTAGDEVARAKRQGKDASAIFEANRQRAQQIRQLGIELDQVEQQRTSSADGAAEPAARERAASARSEADNVVVRTWGEPTTFDFEPQAHWDLGPALGILDFERATKMSGARFSVLLGRRRAAVARADRLHARSAHARARVRRGRAAVSREPRVARSAPGSCRSSKPICSRSQASGISF